jgi:hypothetical protein
MAKRDTIIIRGERFPCVNVDGSVGDRAKHADNLEGDVWLIQAIFITLVDSKYGLSVLGLKSAADVPKPTGKCDSLLENAILSFQKLDGSKGWESWTDGVIHPASYKDRDLKRLGRPGNYRLMTITALHLLLAGAFGRDYVPELTRRVPALLSWLK